MLCVCGFGATLSSAPGFLVALYSEMTPEGLRGPCRVLRVQPRYTMCKTSALLAMLLP